jgi:hypothetical protein
MSLYMSEVVEVIELNHRSICIVENVNEVL